MTRYLTIACFVASLTAQTTLDVHVYDWADTPASTLEETGRTLGRIFRPSGIEVRWIVESPSAPEARIVKIVDTPRNGSTRKLECAARRDIGLSILQDSAAELRAGVLGTANPLAPSGINATVFRSRVSDQAREHGIRLGDLLAHAIAHEIGHVLLRTAQHRKHGLMAGGWDAYQFRWIRAAGMFFEKSDSRAMQASIAGQGCETTAAQTAFATHPISHIR